MQLVRDRRSAPRAFGLRGRSSGRAPSTSRSSRLASSASSWRVGYLAVDPDARRSLDRHSHKPISAPTASMPTSTGVFPYAARPRTNVLVELVGRRVGATASPNAHAYSEPVARASRHASTAYSVMCAPLPLPGRSPTCPAPSSARGSTRKQRSRPSRGAREASGRSSRGDGRLPPHKGRVVREPGCESGTVLPL